MKTMKKILFAVVATVLVCSCAKDNTENTTVNDKANLVYREFTADVAAITRAHLGTPDTENGTIDVYLDAGDEILFVNENAEAATVAISKIENGLAYISGEVPEGTLTACYPAWAYSTSGTLSIPTTQNFSSGVPVAMTATIDADNHLTFTADESAAILAIPIKGDIKLEKILLYSKDPRSGKSGVEAATWFIKRNDPKEDYNMNDISTQLSDDELMVYFLVASGDKFITLEFQSSTVPQSSKDMATNTSKVSGKNNLGYRYYRRMATSAPKAVNGVVKLPTTILTLDELDSDRYLLHMGTTVPNGKKDIGTEGYAQVSNFSGQTKDNLTGVNNTVLQSENCIEVTLSNNTQINKQPITVDQMVEGTAVSYRGDFGIGSAILPVSAGSYRYLAVKSNMRTVTQNECWTAAKGVVKLSIGREVVDGTTTYYEIWLDRGCKDTGHFSYVQTDSEGEEILVFDMLSAFFGANVYHFLPTSRTIELSEFKFIVADMKRTLTAEDFDADGNCIFEAPTVRVEWMGFFTSIDEISAYKNN